MEKCGKEHVLANHGGRRRRGWGYNISIPTPRKHDFSKYYNFSENF
jgi:hypothetical protein